MLTGAITNVATVAQSDPLALLVWGALTATFYRMGCPAAGSGILGFIAWLIWKLQQMLRDITTYTKEQVERFWEVGKAGLKQVGLSFLNPLIDAARDLMNQGFDALLTPLVQSAILAVLGAWLILRLTKR